MRQTFHLGRLPALLHHLQVKSLRSACRAHRFFSSTRQQHRTVPFRIYTKFPKAKVLLAAGTLTPGAFVALSEEKNGDGKTGEEHMLEASRRELAEYVPPVLRGSNKTGRSIWFFVDQWIIEPVATGFRFLHLVLIFVPVIVTVPAIWLGRRVKERDNERKGTLWWYSYLVWSMERAGPAFIKVSLPKCLDITIAYMDFSCKARAMGSFSRRHLPYRDVQNNVQPPF